MKVRAKKKQSKKGVTQAPRSKIARAGVVSSIRQAITGRKPVARAVAPVAKPSRRRQKAA